MKDLTAKDVMNGEVLTVSPDLTVHELAVFLLENQISGAPVADERGRFLGLASLTDIAESAAMGEECPEPEGDSPRNGRGSDRREDVRGLRIRRTGLLVRDIMTPAVFAVAEDTPVRQLAQTMIAGRIHRLLIKRGTRVVGIVTSLDLLRQLVDEPKVAPTPVVRRPGAKAALGLVIAAVLAAGCDRSSFLEARPSAPAARLVSPAPALPQDHPPVPAMSVAESVAGTVTLAPAIRAWAPRGAVLFLLARSSKDRQIVAVRMDEGVTFPHTFELSSNDAMTHGAAFGGTLELTTRLSRTGDAAPAPGDLEGHVSEVASGSRSVRVDLDTVHE